MWGIKGANVFMCNEAAFCLYIYQYSNSIFKNKKESRCVSMMKDMLNSSTVSVG